jgi:hypothetical protein
MNPIHRPPIQKKGRGWIVKNDFCESEDVSDNKIIHIHKCFKHVLDFTLIHTDWEIATMKSAFKYGAIDNNHCRGISEFGL